MNPKEIVLATLLSASVLATVVWLLFGDKAVRVLAVGPLGWLAMAAKALADAYFGKRFYKVTFYYVQETSREVSPGNAQLRAEIVDLETAYVRGGERSYGRLTKRKKELSRQKGVAVDAVARKVTFPEYAKSKYFKKRGN